VYLVIQSLRQAFLFSSKASRTMYVYSMMGSRLMQHSKMFSTNIACCVIGVDVKKQHDPPRKLFEKSSFDIFW